jgi:NAD(P)-dependent dehydrogenase (short-subunit alcohol dehydrogenase family)
MGRQMDPADLFSIRGKTAVVTGGSRGIGKMIATGFVAAGARVYICARKADACDATATELSSFGECISLPADLSTEAGAQDLVRRVSERESKLHILVNNAGAAWGAPLEEYPDAAFDKVLSVNVKGVFHLTRLLLPLLRAAATESDPACIVNIGSVDGLKVPRTENYAYSASKAAVHMLTRHLGHALVGDHVNVNAIAPGLFPTRMTAYLFESEDAATVVDHIPMKRPGTAEDIAAAAIYLSSRASAYLTGVVLPVSGGIATID